MYAIAAVFIIGYLSAAANHPLLEPDEGRYAEIPREMIESGDYVTPRLNYVKYFEKPVMLYWMNAASYKIFGENEFASRLPTALCALLGIAAAGALGAYMYGRAAGVLSALVTGTSLLYFAIGTIDLTDMPVSFFMTACMAAFYAGANTGDRRWYVVFYAAMAMALLTKGLIGIILPGGVAFWYIAATRKWRVIREALYLPGIVVFFAVSVPWFYLVCRENPDFFRFFFIQEHFLRYTTRMHNRYEPVWFFLPLIPAGIMPWTGFLPSLLGRDGVLRSPGSRERRDANIFLLLWFGIILSFFSLSSSKLIPYIIPCVPPLAILIAANISRMKEGNRFFGGALEWTAGISVVITAALLIFAAATDYVDTSEAMLAALPSLAGLMTGAVFMPVVWKRTRDTGRAVAAFACGALVFVMGLQAVYIPIGKDRSARDVSYYASALKRPEEKIAVYGEILQGVPFYTKQRVVLVSSLGELEYGAGCESEKDRTGWFPEKYEFLQRWYGGEPFALIINKDSLPRLFGSSSEKARGMTVGDYVIMFNRNKRGEP